MLRKTVFVVLYGISAIALGQSNDSKKAAADVKPQSRAAIKHQHNGREHTHVLPADGLKHSHGVKPIEPEMIDIPAGVFTMGCVEGRDNVPNDACDSKETPSQQVRIAAFKMGKTEVTFDEWDACHKAGACINAGDADLGRGKRPVIRVTWNEVQTYIRWLNKTTGKRYQLPTEAHWEYAARGGRSSIFPWGNTIGCEDANFGYKWDRCDVVGTTPVASYPPNAFGLYDVIGNVYEWTQDCFQDNHKGASINGAARTNCEGKRRVMRGGSFANDGAFVRTAVRSGNKPDGRNSNVGFRLAIIDG